MNITRIPSRSRVHPAVTLRRPRTVAARARTTNKLPPLAGRMRDLLDRLVDPDLDAPALARLAERIPGLAARLLDLANTAQPGAGRPATSVRDAIVAGIGLSAARDLAVAFLLARPFELDRCAGFDRLHYWQGAMSLALLAQLLASRSPQRGGVSPSSAHLAGLLRNLGLLALVHAAPEAMQRVFTTAAQTPRASLYDIEYRVLGRDHAIAGAELAADWRLPEALAVAIGPLSEAQSGGRHESLAALMVVATRMQRRLHLDPGFADWQSLQATCGQMGVDVGRLPAVIATWRERLDHVRGQASAFCKPPQ